MARFTSIGMPKKSFVASGAEESHQPAQAQSESGPSTAKPDQPPAKKRKRRGTRGKVVPEGGEAAPQSAETKGWSRDHSVAKRAKLSAQHAFERRENRQNDRTSATTCFACRSVGHPARECPNVLLALEQGEGSAALLDEGGDKEQLEKEKKGMKRKPGKKGGDIVGGKCYRCNGQHSLHQCPEKVDPKNPTPFATCYICLGTGHLSSLCPSNGRGVYPNGGSCKVCGSKAHRASDCPDDKRPKEDKPRRGEILLGTAMGGMGADEDDFMVDSRQNMRETKDGKGKKKKHAVNNNSARAPYKSEEERFVVEDNEPRMAEDGEATVPKIKPKKKVIAF